MCGKNFSKVKSSMSNVRLQHWKGGSPSCICDVWREWRCGSQDDKLLKKLCTKSRRCLSIYTSTSSGVTGWNCGSGNLEAQNRKSWKHLYEVRSLKLKPTYLRRPDTQMQQLYLTNCGLLPIMFEIYRIRIQNKIHFSFVDSQREVIEVHFIIV